MAQANEGDTVRIHYTGRLDDGTVFDTSQNREPLEFTLGEGKVIPGFESAVNGMTEGDSKTAKIPSDDAYGEHREDLVLTVSKDQLPDGLDPSVGQQLQMQAGDGQVFQVTISDVQDETVEVDANHPLAGRDLTFEIELVAIR